MGAPLGLRKSIAATGCEHRLHGGIQTNPIALGNKDRRYPIFCPKDHADLFAAIEQRLKATTALPGFLMRPH